MNKLNRRMLFVWLMLIGFSRASAAQELTLMLDWFVNPDHGPLIVAQQQGLFKEQGLDITIQEPTDPSLPAKLVAAGKVDFAVSYQPQLIQDVAAGLPLTRTATLISTPLNTLMVLASSDVNKVADLKGKKIGIAIADGVSESTVATMLTNSGVSLDDVEIIHVGWGLSSSLVSKTVDAVYGGFRNFEMNQLAIEGYQGRAFFVEEEGIPPYDELIVVAKTNQLSDETIAKFNRAVELATQYLINHPNEAWEIFKAYKADLDTELNRLAWKDTLPRFALRPAALDAKRYDDYAEFLQATGLIDKAPASTDYLQ